MRNRLAIPLLGLMLSSCTVGPNYKRPSQRMPTTFQSATTQEAETGSHLSRNWWRLFDDEKLNALEDEAVRANPDIRAAMDRVLEARAAADITASGFYPVVTLDPSFHRNRTPANPNNNNNNNNSNNNSSRSRTSNVIQVPFDLTYEVDIWGKIRRSYEASNATAVASADDFEVVMQTIEADVAQDYFGIRSLVAQQRILDETVQSFRQQVDLTQTQFKAGLVGPTDAYQAEAQLDATVTQAIENQRQTRDLVHALAILLNKSPGEMELKAEPLNTIPPTVPAGLPVTLLQNRPDVAEAEQNLVAANAEIGVATAAFLPDITLSGDAGFESFDVSHTFNWENRIWGIGVNAAQPIFEGGKLSAGLTEVKARYDELNATYRSTVLGAIRDVEDSLTDVHLRSDESAAAQKAVQSSREYLRLSQLQYKQGLVSYLQVIDAERTLLNDELSDAQITNQRLDSTVLLIKALGGGWEIGTPTTAPDAATTQPSP